MEFGNRLLNYGRIVFNSFPARAKGIYISCCFHSVNKIYLFLFLFIFIHSSTLFSQTYSFKHYASADGLVPFGLKSIFQDSKGYIWFSGLGGVYRYDGFKVIPYLSEHTHSIVKNMVEDKSGTIYISTEGDGIALVKNGNNDVDWITKKDGLLTSDSVYCVLPDNNGNLWIGTKRGTVFLHSDSSFSFIKTKKGGLDNWVRNIVQDDKGNIWIASLGNLTRVTYDGKRITSQKIIHDAPVLSLDVCNDGSLIFGTNEKTGNENNKGIYSYKNGKLQKLVAPESFSEPPKILSLMEDSRGVIWAGTRLGIIIYDNGTIKHLRLINRLKNEIITSIMEDREGTIWFATPEGAMKLTRPYTISYTTLNGLVGSGMLTSMVDNENNAWFGGWLGLYKIGADSRLIVMNKKSPLVDRQIWSLAQDNEGTLWIGTYGGLVKYKDEKFSEQFLGNFDKKPIISALAVDKDGSIWAGMESRLLNIYNGKIRKTFTSDEGLPYEGIIELYFDSKGRLWFGTRGDGGGYLYNDSIIVYNLSDGVPQHNVESIVEDAEGRIWFGTRKGAAYIDLNELSNSNKVFQKANFEASVLNEFPVFKILKDSKNNLWFGSWKGAFKYSDSTLIHFDTRDGLISDDIQSLVEDKNGNFWFATGSGISKLENSFQYNSLPETDLKINRISDDSESKILSSITEIPYSERTIKFHFTYLSFIDEKNTEFRYLLKGLEEKWSSPAKLRTIRFTTLPAGKYTLFAKAKNRHGNWTEPVSYSFIILPPFYETWWFRLIAGITVAGIFVFVIIVRTKNLTKEKRRQEEYSEKLIRSQENERKRIASELHDSLGQNLLLINNEVQQLIQHNYKEEDNELNEIRDLIKESISEVRTISSNLHPHQLERLGLTKSIQSIIKKASHASPGIKFVSDITNIDNIINKKDEIHLYRIIQECINNILKHSDADKVKISIDKFDDLLQIKISDNGKGFNLSGIENITDKSGLGIQDIFNRTKIINAELTFNTAEGKGTTIILKKYSGIKNGK